MTLTQLAEAVELLNQIFDADLGWFEPRDRQLSPEAALVLADNLERLIDMLSDSWVVGAFHMMLAYQNLMAHALVDPSYMTAFGILGNKQFEQQRTLTDEEVDTLFSLFLRHEEVVLREVGFNQNSVAVIMQRIEAKAEAIKVRMKRRQLMSQSRYKAGVVTFETTAMRVVQRAADGHGISLASKDLSVLREKAVAVATIFGDGIPFLLTNDLSITGVISTIAGATIGAMWPNPPR